MKETHACPRCGSPVIASGRGRPPVWCSDTCRTDAYRDRRAARRGVVALEVREVERVRTVEPSWDEVVQRVTDSPKATARVLRHVAQMHQDGRLTQHEQGAVRNALYDLLHATRNL